MTYPQDININIQTKVILTDAGAKIINAHNKQFHLSGDSAKDERFFPTHYQEGDTYSSCLWDLMKIFGPNMHMGAQAYFKKNLITFLG